jgi:monoamine oxidase
MLKACGGKEAVMTERHVIVVGAGLAGVAAARLLVGAGCRVTVLEARDRTGGRAFARPFPQETELLEYGGSWITPWHGRIRALVVECGLSLRPRPPVTTRLWLRDGAISSDGPVAPQDRARHERALARVAADAILLKTGTAVDEKGRPLTGISFAVYLDRLAAPLATRNLFSAWWTVSGNGDQSLVAASEFLGSCAYGEGLAEGMIDVWADTVVPGMAALAERMIATSGATLRVETPVAAITQDNSSLHVTTAGGFTIEAQACVVALGVNQLRGIAFTPALPFAKQVAVAEGHGGRAFKVWAKIRGVQLGTLVTGDGSGIEFAFAERTAADGTTMIIGFGLELNGASPRSPDWVRRQLSRLFPNAEVIASDCHDWVNDPFAHGTWVAAYAGHEAHLAFDIWQAEQRISFASSDIARDQAGWFEGAVISGEDAAAEVLSRVL